MANTRLMIRRYWDAKIAILKTARAATNVAHALERNVRASKVVAMAMFILRLGRGGERKLLQPGHQEG